MPLKITIETEDGKKYEIPNTLVLTPAPAKPKSVMVNVINWGVSALTNLPQGSTELANFIFPVTSAGALLPQNTLAVEQKFIADVKAAGKPVTLSIAGGRQSGADIISALTQRTNLVNSISTRITQFGYDGVVLDIENVPTLNPQTLVDFVNALRVRIPGKIIGMYTQPNQLLNSHSKIEQCVQALTWLAPMIYDMPGVYYNKEKWISLTNAWLAKVPKEKLMIGVAVNYTPSLGGLNLTQFGEVLDMVISQGWKGVGIWEHTLLTQPYIDLIKTKL